ncbi:MAG: Gfo/Idh/MocA family oxidoreductase [Planctomycetota bacterium]|jgi:predicted dehydrogenase|nr:Gfo/Idh/MocA family oxidoreductase [Planctomycetota bacterium]
MTTPFRMGFIGVAGIAKAHMKHAQPIDGVELHAIADISEDALKKVGDEFEISGRYTDYKEMLRDETLDSVSVCTPNFLHCQPTIDALEAGKHVIVEKPMAMTVDECERMCAAAKASGKQLVTGFQWRFTEKAQFLRDQVAGGAFGEIHYVRVQALRRRGIPSWGVFTDKSKQGGGAMIDIGVHLVEMAHYICGKPNPVAAYGSQWTSIGNKPCDAQCSWGVWKHDNYTVEDAAVGMVKFDNNMTMMVETSFAAHIKEDVMNVTIMGSKGGGTFNPLEISYDQNGYMLNAAPHFVAKKSDFAEKMRHFIETCRGERSNDSTGEDGLAVQKILNGIYDAIDANAEIRYS